MCAALAASKILKNLAEEEVDEGDEAEKMWELADYYEKQAIGTSTIKICFHLYFCGLYYFLTEVI